ncbi:MAG: cell division protein, partial [Oceanospirillaceae bacterium]|nr:cell division protein [Oceanospirillaceae bacterium]
VIAWVLIQVSLLLLEPPVERLAELYESQFEISGLGWQGSILLILVSTLLGLAGSWLAVGRHLREVEPR